MKRFEDVRRKANDLVTEGKITEEHYGIMWGNHRGKRRRWAQILARVPDGQSCHFRLRRYLNAYCVPLILAT
jgi:hypothetical protein